MAIAPADYKLLAERAVPMVPPPRPYRPRTAVTLGPVDLAPGCAADDFRELLAGWGFGRVIAVDAYDHPGVDRRVDLNRDLPPDLCHAADLVIDPGTIEHVWDAGQAFSDVLSLLAPGGVAFHHTPMNWVDHGYHNLCPSWWRDGYAANGCRVELYWRAASDAVSQPWSNPRDLTRILPQRRYLLNVIARAPAAGVRGWRIPDQARWARKLEVRHGAP